MSSRDVTTVPLARKHALQIAPADAIYSYVPKNACTTLRYATVLANTGASPPDLFDQMDEVFTEYVATEDQISSARYRFIVLRCPWQRLSSVFLDKFVGGKRTGRALRLSSDRQNRSRASALLFRGLYRLGLTSYINPERFSFRNFVELLGAQEALDIDHHWTPQARHDLGALGYPYTDVFGMHALEEAFLRISEATGMTIVDTRGMSGHATQSLQLLTEGCFADTPLVDLAKLRTQGFAPAHGAMYDRALLRQVAEIYTEDFAFYEKHLGSAGLTFGSS